MKRFEGKTILATGAASGIGFATAEQFARAGGTVVTDINLDGLKKAFAKLHDEGLRIETEKQDVTDRETWTRTVQGIVDRHGQLDVLFNMLAVGIHHNTVERNGKRLDVDSCIVFEFKNGKVIDGKEHIYDLYAWDDFWS